MFCKTKIKDFLEQNIFCKTKTENIFKQSLKLFCKTKTEKFLVERKSFVKQKIKNIKNYFL